MTEEVDGVTEVTVEVEVDETTVETGEVTMTVEVDQVTEVEENVLINEDVLGVQDQEVGEAVISVTQVVYEEVVEGNEIKRTFLYSVIY